MIFHSKKGLFNKNPSFGSFLGDLPESWEKFQSVGWVHYFYSIAWFKKNKTELIVSISAELSLEVLHELFAPWNQNFPKGEPSCNDKRLGWDSLDREAQCFWDYCIVSILTGYFIGYIYTNSLHPFFFVDSKHSVLCNLFDLS